MPVERSCSDNIVIMGFPGTYFLLRSLQNQTHCSKQEFPVSFLRLELLRKGEVSLKWLRFELCRPSRSNMELPETIIASTLCKTDYRQEPFVEHSR